MTELDDRTARRLREVYERTPLDPAARARVMEVVRKAPAPRRGWGGLGALFRARTFQFPPLAAATAAMVLVVAGVWLGWSARGRDPGGKTPQVPGAAGIAASTPETIEFVLVAPGASSVALVGDFNGWDVEATPMRRVGSGGTWAITLPLAPGRHVYAFVLDRRRWLADPVAPLAPEDGFGFRNSVVVVGDQGPT